jgi:hypothetical protein
MATGERTIGVLLILVGIVWMTESLTLTYMSEFAPGSGFLPFWLGALLVGLSLLLVFQTFGAERAGPAEDAAPPGAWRKNAAIALGLVASVVAIEWVGFALAVAAYLVFLVRGVERRPWRAALGLSLGTTASLFLIFKAWLKVPLPTGPWGF